MTTTHFNPPPAKRVRVQSDDNPHPLWLLVPTASRTVQDLLKSLLVRLRLPCTSTYDLCLDGTPILPDEDITLVRDGEQLHLRQRHTPPNTPTNSQPSLDLPNMSATSNPENEPFQNHRKRKRVLTPDGKRRRNARNRKREKRRRLERRQSQQHIPTPNPNPLANTHPPNHSQVLHSSPEDHPRSAENGLHTGNSAPTPQQPENSLQNEQTEPNPSQQIPEDHSNGEEILSAAKENGSSSVPVIRHIQHIERERAAQNVPQGRRAADKEVTPSLKNSIHTVNLATSHRNLSLPAERLKSISSTEVPTWTPNDSASLTKEPSKCRPRGTPTCPDVSSQKPNQPLSYVFLQKVSIEPFSTSLPQKHSSEQTKELENAKPQDIRKASMLRPPIDARPAENQAATGKSAGVERVAEISSIEKKTTGEVPTNTGEKPSEVENDSAENVVPVVAESSIDASGQGRKDSQRKNAERTGDGEENPGEIITEDAKTRMHGSVTPAPMTADNGSVNSSDVAPATHPVSKEGIEGASHTHRKCIGDLTDNVDLSKNVNPRWKRRRRHGKKPNNGRLDLSSKPTRSSLNDEKSPSFQKQGPVERADELEKYSPPTQAKKAGPSVAGVTASGVNASECNVINLVDEDGDEARLFERLPNMHHSHATESGPKSTSPQSIVVSPAEPQAIHPVVGHVDIEGLKKCPSQFAEEIIESVVHSEREERRQGGEAESARASRRKPARPTRLKKPDTDRDVNNINASANAPSEEASHYHEEKLVTLETLKQAVVKDLQTSKPIELIQDRKSTPLPAEEPVKGVPGSNRIPKDSSRRDSRNEGKKKLNPLKGGLSTLAALRVAKAHGAIRSSSPKAKHDAILQNGGPRPSSTAAVSEQVTQTVDSEMRPLKDATRKKSKRSKRSRKAVRYLNEEQVNKSTFLGYKNIQETLLPPLELLELPEDSNELDQIADVLENPLEAGVARESCFEVLSGSKQEAQAASLGTPCDKADENQSFAAAPTEAVPSSKDRSFNGDEHQAEEIAPQCVGNSEVNNVSKQQAPSAPQEPYGTDEGHKGSRMTKRHRLSRSQERAMRSTNVDCFREELVHMLQHTTQTLAKVWSKWEDCDSDQS